MGAGTRTRQEETAEVELECWSAPAACPFVPLTPLIRPGRRAQVRLPPPLCIGHRLPIGSPSHVLYGTT
jgi:hypothetical protein